VITATSSEAALDAASARKLDHAIVDLRLDQESGLDLIPLLKAAEPSINIIVLTGYASIATAVAAMKRGAANYLAKPVEADAVVRALSGEEQLPETGDDYNPMSVERLEWEHIQKVLREHGGNVSATARSLGMYRRTLQRKLAKKPVGR
jgi:two-component system response regulator RegA